MLSSAYLSSRANIPRLSGLTMVEWTALYSVSLSIFCEKWVKNSNLFRVFALQPTHHYIGMSLRNLFIQPSMIGSLFSAIITMSRNHARLLCNPFRTIFFHPKSVVALEWKHCDPIKENESNGLLSGWGGLGGAYRQPRLTTKGGKPITLTANKCCPHNCTKKLVSGQLGPRSIAFRGMIP